MRSEVRGRRHTSREPWDRVDPTIQRLTDSALTGGVVVALALAVYVLVFGNP